MTDTPLAIDGRWDIVSWSQHYDDGRRVYPLGESLTGFIQYHQGAMCCMVARKERAAFTSGGQWDASAPEKAEAYDGFLAYWGRYEVVGDEVIHRVEASLFPNWAGGVQRRRAKLVGGELHLLARLEDGTPQARTASLVWRRPAA